MVFIMIFGIRTFSGQITGMISGLLCARLSKSFLKKEAVLRW